MSLKQNTNNNNSNLKSKKLVGGKLRQKGGADAADADAARVAADAARVAAEAALIGDNTIIPPLSVDVFTETILLPNISDTTPEEEIIKIIKNAHIISGKQEDGKIGTVREDIPDNNWQFRRILVDSMILYYTHASLQGKKAVISFNGKSLYDNYEDLKYNLKYKGLQKSHVDDIILSLHQNIRNTTPFNEVDVVDINYTEENGKGGELNNMTVTVTSVNAKSIVTKLNALNALNEKIFTKLKVTFKEE